MATEIQRPDFDFKKALGNVLTVNRLASGISIYESDRISELSPESNLPFLIGPKPFALPNSVAEQLPLIGTAVVNFYKSCNALYRELPPDSRWRRYLDFNKPDFLLSADENNQDQYHPFIRPDFILTSEGLAATEIETSPFGLALAHFLNHSYQSVGEQTIVSPDVFTDEFTQFILSNCVVEKRLCFVVTPHTEKYIGQFHYLAELLAAAGVEIVVAHSDEIEIGQHPKVGEKHVNNFYRGFYMFETVENPNLKTLIESQAVVIPVCKPHLEEKALMAMLYEPEFETWFKEHLGSDFDIVRELIPPTFILDRNFVPQNFPREISEWSQLASLPRKDRQYVLKMSGFNPHASWGKSVIFLHSISSENCRKVVHQACDSGDLWVIQEFRNGQKYDQDYFDFNEGGFKTMKGKVRVTPYYSTADGKLLTAKATMCPNTDYIHAGTHSLNMPIV